MNEWNVTRITFVLEVELKLNPGWDVSVKWPQHFSCHTTFPASLSTELYEEAYWKQLLLCNLNFTVEFRNPLALGVLYFHIVQTCNRKAI